MTVQSVVVVGGGIAGLVASALIAEKKSKVLLIEANNVLGGLLRTADYGLDGRFDFGPHLFSQSGIDDLDDLLVGLLPRDDWHFFSGPMRDLAGAYFGGRLLDGNPYPDLRVLPAPQLRACIADFFINLESTSNIAESTNARQEAERLFGPVICDNVFEAICGKLYGSSLGELTPFALRLTPLSRVTMFREKLSEALILADEVRTRIAYPNQLGLPEKYQNPQYAYYPKLFGIGRLIEVLRNRLLARNVEILCDTKVLGVIRSDDRISAVNIRTPRGDAIVDNVSRIVWSAGPVALGRSLGVPGNFNAQLNEKQTALVNFLLKDKPEMGALYYFYCYDPGFGTFRVTSFSAYCPDAMQNGHYPLSVEYKIPPHLVGAVDEEILRSALSEMVIMGIVAPTTHPVASRVIRMPYAFPVPTRQNLEEIERINREVDSLGICNLTRIGAMSRHDLFFQSDVLVDTFRKIHADQPL